MSHGFILGCRWFAQKIERAFNSKTPRYFDKEKNSALLRELQEKVDEIGAALEMGVGEVDACVAVGSLAQMIAMNVERGVGGEESTVASTPDVKVPADGAAAPAEKPKAKATKKK